MDQVYSVPVKSLVATEEDDDEEEENFYDAEDRYIKSYNGNDSDQESVLSDSISEESPSPSPSPVHQPEVVYILKNCLEGSLFHLFLPKKLPDNAQSNLVDIEVWILQQCADISSQVLQPFPKLHPILRMLQKWKSCQPRNIHDRDLISEKLSQELGNMEVGDTIPVYVRKQNGTILFSKLAQSPQFTSSSEQTNGNEKGVPVDVTILVDTFRACFPSETIMSTVGSLRATYPETSDLIYNTNMLCSEVFSRQLHELSVEQMEISMRTSSKAEKNYLEHREVSDSFLVSDWIVALLVPSASSASSPKEYPKVLKKIRDEVNCRRSAQAIPFRRSGMWTSIKVSLHLKLMRMTGNEQEAKILYKCLLLRILATTCHQYSDRSGQTFQLDLAGQLIGKLGRRVKKLKKLTCDKNSPFATEIIHLFSNTVKFVQIVVGEVHKKMKQIWLNSCQSSKEDLIPRIIRSKEEFQRDLLHGIPWLNKFILTESTSSKFSKKISPPNTIHPSPLHTNSKLGCLERLLRFYDLEGILDSYEEITDRKQLKIWQYDAGHFIKFHCETHTFSNHSPNTLMELGMNYIKEAFMSSIDNPLEFSQLVLVILKLIQLLDQMAILKFPMLREYRSGINPGKIHKLLLPHSADMKLLAMILDYFQDRDGKAKYPGILDKLLEEIPENCFASRFASSNEEMIKLRENIIQDMNSRVEAKQAEVEKVRIQCTKLEEKLQEKKLTCEACKEILNSAKEEKNEKDIDPSGDNDSAVVKCEDCIKLGEELEEKRYSISVYEKPLPSEEHLQNAVIFELAIPDEIKNLRELLSLLKFDILREQHRKLDAKSQIHWIDYRPLKKYRKILAESPESVFLLANLSSRLLPTSTTHHTLIKNPDVMSSRKVDQDDPFIVPNGLECVYHYSCHNFVGSVPSSSNPLIKNCSFQLSTTTTETGSSSSDEDPYQTLQWALDTTTHSQNRIIAEFSSTHHPDLIAFGSLRAGHRIQLMNLYRYIANKQLQLEKEPVVALLLQTLWEVGPRLEGNHNHGHGQGGGTNEDENVGLVNADKVDRRMSCWESHLDFMDLEFTEEFLELLEKLVESNDTNYANPLILLCIVVITVRILEVNRSYRERCYKLLKKCRKCADRWMDKIQNEIWKKMDDMEDAFLEEDPQQEMNLRKIQLEIVIASALSFNVDSEGDEELFHYVIQDGEDLMHWYEALSSLYELAPKEDRNYVNGDAPTISPFLKGLLGLAQNVPLKLKLEEKLNSNLVSTKFNDLYVKSLHIFGCMKWEVSSTAGTWKALEQAPNIVMGRYQNQYLTFDMLQGEFLVNGFSQSGMPTIILQSPLYELYFRGTRKLKVVQFCYAEGKKDEVFFRTSEKFHEKHYEFEVPVNGLSNKVRIREVDEELGTKLELLKPDKFRGCLGGDFITQFTHWLDIEKNILYFRRLPQKDADYDLKPEFKLILEPESNSWLLRDELHDSFLFSKKSPGYKLISSALSRLELQKYVNVVMRGDGEIMAKLPRHNLNFVLSPEHGRLASAEYKDFSVSLNQGEKGTLIGLQHGLLLDNGPGGKEEENTTIELYPVKRLLLVPHGKINIEKRHSHPLIKIDLHNLHQPSFFSYELDSILKRVKADRSKCAWLYLAALHGATSSCSTSLPDQFTGMTGLEMSVQILQSGCIWSCSPYDYESLFILKTIRSFAPRRVYYGHGLSSATLRRNPAKSIKRTGGDQEEAAQPLEEKKEQMETTEWPSGLYPMAAYDGYAIIVDRLVKDCNRLKVLYSTGDIPFEDDWKWFMDGRKFSEKLQVRAYYRHLASYNKAATIDPNFFLNSSQKLNENGELPDFPIRKRAPGDDPPEQTLSEAFQLDLLLRMSQARYIMTLEEPPQASKRRSNLTSFLLSPDSSREHQVILPALPIPSVDASGIPTRHLLEADFIQNWLKFYTMAVQWTNNEEEIETFSIVLNALAYQGVSIDQLLNLHNVNVLAKTINFPTIPESIRTCSFVDFETDNDFHEDRLKMFLENNARSGKLSHYKPSRVYLNGNDSESSEGEDKLKRYEGKLKLEETIDLVVKKLREHWPCEKIPRKKLDEIYAKTDGLWTNHNLKEINSMVTKWFRNYQLKQFIGSVETFLDKFYEHFPNIPKHSKQFDLMKEMSAEVTIDPPIPSDDNIFGDLSSIVISGDLDESGVIFYSGSGFQETTSETLIPTQKEQCISKIERYLGLINAGIAEGGASKQTISMAGLAPRTNPVQLLRYLLHGLSLPPGTLNPGFLKLLGALAVLWTELKRFNRILSLTKDKSKTGAELKSELDNPGHENWSPVEHPEWLILELELDIMIRPIQVQVAKQMMKMPNGKNGVVQLNMGEGKTSVIVPMLCLSLSQEQDSLCRITVLNSLFKTNLNLLTFSLGGIILSRRVYTFPCRRDMKITVEVLDTILECYQECLKRKGVVITLPEYRLSFRLLAFDKTLKGYPEVGLRFLEIENGLRRYSRDILDESDELLNVKYQLVYTIGMQVPVDGGNLRWVTCQKLLQIVQDVAWIFLSKMGTSSVEFDKEVQQLHPERFAHVRLLDQSAHEEFLSLVADEVLKELKLTERQKQVVKKFLTQERISQENFKFVLSLFKNDAGLLDEIRLLSGYLRRGILTLALSKRWRVEYGVDPKGSSYRRMAVPFRAKDFAAERTEFGHPDLAIILTHLSYYYSGLKDEELEGCFEVLKNKPEAESIYSSWIGRFSSQEQAPKYLLSFGAINLHDAYQRQTLFGLLRKHKAVIDFYLSHKVFPEESKQFPGKIVMNAWDLCYEKQRLPITGFSGTNDSSVLLPLPITQQDLQELQDTNRRMEGVLLQKENEGHKGLKMGVTCRTILEQMKNDSLKILVDSGALMLELNNEQVAHLWLEIDPHIDAVVYFSQDNDILVKCRKELEKVQSSEKKQKSKSPHRSKDQSQSQLETDSINQAERCTDVQLELSPFRDRLEKCAVFLDDRHTRGTDLKFPTGSKACVTIGSRMRRDKLMQACMRMRQLGNGHSVTFYLSHEAYTKVMKGKPSKNNSQSQSLQGDKEKGEILTQDILQWVTENTKEFNNEGLVYWALAGKNYAQKLAAQEFHDSVDTHPLEKIFTLAKQCEDAEVLTLKDLYGTYTEAELLTKLIPEWFELTQRKLMNVEGCYSLSQRITKRYDFIKNEVKNRCTEYIPEKTYLTGGLTTMEEEQEKEVEKEREAEAEEERQVIQEGKLDYVKHSSVHENVRQAVLLGKKFEEKAGISKLSDIFEKTSFAKLVQPEGWMGAEVYASTDFISVVKPFEGDDPDSHFKTDSHLRPIEFVVSLRPQRPVTTSSRKSIPVTPAPIQCLVLSPFEVNELMPYFRSGKAQTHLHMFSARYFQNQSLLLNNGSLQVPRPLTLQAQNAPVLLNIIPDGSKCLAALFLASGNLYFGYMEEQRTFAKFLGLVPRPWSAEQMNAFEKEMIKKTGFLLPKFRRQQMDSCQIEQGAFQKDPIPLVRKILMCRHAVVSDVAHVSRLLNQNWFVELNQ